MTGKASATISGKVCRDGGGIFGAMTHRALHRVDGIPALEGKRRFPLAVDLVAQLLGRSAGSLSVVFSPRGVQHAARHVDDESRALGVQGLPTTVLIGQDGRERGRLVGAAEWDSPEDFKLVTTCLGGAGQP